MRPQGCDASSPAHSTVGPLAYDARAVGLPGPPTTVGRRAGAVPVRPAMGRLLPRAGGPPGRSRREPSRGASAPPTPAGHGAERTKSEARRREPDQVRAQSSDTDRLSDGGESAVASGIPPG